MIKRRATVAALLASLLAIAIPSGPAAADDWPAWRGPNRDGICQETGLLKVWPRGGPPLVWKTASIGEGFSGPAVVGDVLYTMGNGNGKEWVVALDLKQGGRQIWASATGPIGHDGGGYPGPRCTPSLDGKRLYALGIGGELVCMNTADGQIVWHRNLVGDFGGSVPEWGYSESVLVDGPWVICTPGGRRATIAALDKTDGRPVWTSPIGDPAAYSSVISVSIGRVKQYVAFTAKGVVGVAADDGTPLWRYGRPANRTAVIPTPVWWGQTVFAASGYGTGGGLVWVRATPQGFLPQELYFTKDMQNHHGGVIRVGGYLYGCSNPGILTCLDYKTGRTLWQDRGPGKCSLLYADGLLYCRSEKGPISLVEATPEGFRLKGRFDQPDRSNKNAWPHPVIADGMMYLRDQNVLLCYDVRARRRR
ncbi:MAG: PQQ-like beta-propeller repeat protein [Pirellulales bacterium]|nr:PQQ-like beta-propeller repeat protein [Pirellulales bacterium]